MSDATVLLQVTADIARLTLNRPDRLNSFTTAMHEELRRALAAVSASGARVLVLTGAGRGFCAGQDLADRALSPGAAPVDLGDSVERYYKPLVRTLRQLPMPVLAAVNGVAAGAGVSVALACDLVVATRSASFVQAFSRVGLVPDTGGTWFLPRRVGEARAMGLAMLAEKLSAERAADWGLIWRCIDDERFADEVETIARRLADAPTRALVRTRELMQAGWSRTLDEQLDAERDCMRELGASADHREGVAAFLDKRAPKFTGR